MAKHGRTRPQTSTANVWHGTVDAARLKDFIEGWQEDTETKRLSYLKGALEVAGAMGAWHLYRNFRAERKGRP
jgi:hypothetical protein